MLEPLQTHPTTPSAWTASASACIRAIAFSRAWYIAPVSTVGSWLCIRFCGCQPMWGAFSWAGSPIELSSV
ncbi:MAG: hypothetical protein H0V92_11605 [Pseudonocardiales bacterium]|nr:hypothetical protein [Pseudonocardiales bacterium]